MSKRNDPVARARGKAAATKKPFPLGFVIGSVVLAVALIGILVYAVQNQGEGDRTSEAFLRNNIDKLEQQKDQARDHVEGSVQYDKADQVPPTGGKHSGVAQACQVYSAPVNNENAVHSLEHGAVWVTYNPDKISDKELEALTEKVEGDSHRMLSPYPGLKTKLSLQAWGYRVMADSVDDDRVDEFLRGFTNGPQTPEPGAACDGTTATRGSTPVTPAPGQSTMPSATQK